MQHKYSPFKNSSTIVQDLFSHKHDNPAIFGPLQHVIIDLSHTLITDR